MKKRSLAPRSTKRAALGCQMDLDRFKRRALPNREYVLSAEEKKNTATEMPVDSLAAAVATPPKAESRTPTPVNRKVGIDRREVILAALLMVIFAALAGLAGLGSYDPDNCIKISSYSFSLDLLKWSAIGGILMVPTFIIAVFAINPPRRKPAFQRTLHVFSWIFFTICGVLAHMVLTVILAQYLKVPTYPSHLISALLVLLYEYLIIKLYAYGCLESNFIVWEIFRFALVGVVAALADFLCTSATRAALNSTGLLNIEHGDIAITAIAVTVGFTISVIVNYILSVYMVYKAATRSTSRKWWGVILFIALSAVGLVIGMGIEMWLFNHVGLPYIAVFIIRTLVVLVWNYVSRKLILFR